MKESELNPGTFQFSVFDMIIAGAVSQELYTPLFEQLSKVVPLTKGTKAVVSSIPHPASSIRRNLTALTGIKQVTDILLRNNEGEYVFISFISETRSEARNETKRGEERRKE